MIEPLRNPSSLHGKRAVITGAASGIGAAIAKSFVEAGASVVLTDTDMVRCRAVALDIGGVPFELDVTSETSWDEFADSYPETDVFVNNAGISASGSDAQDPENSSLEAWRAVHAVNLDGVFMGCRYAIRAMRGKSAGAIINLASSAAMIGVPRAAAYGTSKAGVVSLTKSVALYCAQEGLDIRCNAICPGAIMTPMWEPLLGTGEARHDNIKSIVSDTPAGRFGDPDEVAAVALLLAADHARFVNGAAITVDGGFLAK